MNGNKRIRHVAVSEQYASMQGTGWLLFYTSKTLLDVLSGQWMWRQVVPLNIVVNVKGKFRKSW